MGHHSRENEGIKEVEIGGERNSFKAFLEEGKGKKKGRKEGKRETNKNEKTDLTGSKKGDYIRGRKRKRTSQCTQHQEVPITHIIKPA